MSKDRSFTEYVSNRFYNEIFDAVSDYVVSNTEKLDVRSYVVRDFDTAVLSDITIKQVGVDDLPDMKIAFDVILEAEIEVSVSNRYDGNSDSCYQWFMLNCTGDLSCGLSDFSIHRIGIYGSRQHHEKPLSDSLVPYLYANKTEEAATEFLEKYYPEALWTPMAIDTTVLAQRMGLNVVIQQISEDFTVFGQIFFSETDAEVYDFQSRKTFVRHFEAGTIVVDPQTFLLRNLGSVNNTIVHECVHWDRHRKAFELEHLYNEAATQIKCIVVGGIKEESVRSATDWMEWQANTLAPRIQVPIGAFKTKANEYIRKYRQLKGAYELVDIIESVIDELAVFFCVSRSAAKIRMLDAGYEEAVGSFTYVDGRYVQPYAFKKGAIQRNQTYSISVEDAEIIAFSNMRMMSQAKKGAYVFVDSHMCLNDPKYVVSDENGSVRMTEYGRLHVDECCLVFDLKVKAVNKYGEQFYKECVLFRDVNSGIEFTTSFSKDINDNVMAEADAIINRGREIQNVISAMPPTFGAALVYLMKWNDTTVEKLAEDALVDPKTIQRMCNDPAYPKNIDSVIAVCVAMHLPPEISEALIGRSGFSLRLAQNESHLMYNFFINHYYPHTVYECNEMLMAKGLPELTGTE